MNVAYVITRSDAVGGAHVHVRDLAQHLLERGHRATVLVGGEGPYLSELARLGIPYRALPSLTRDVRPARDLRAWAELRQSLAELRPDLVSTHSSKAGLLGRLAARSLGLPVLFTAHGWAFTEGIPEGERRRYILAERAMAPLANRIVTVSDYDRQLALREGVAPAAKLVTVHNGMPCLDLDSVAAADRDPPTMVMVARFEPQKDHATLLRALVPLRAWPWTLELIGDGPLLPDARRLAQELGLDGRVRFLGARGDVAERLREAQVFVLASRWEGFPRSILEAMRAGLPVVASDVGGVHESVEEGVTGWLVPPGDEGTLTHSLFRLLTSPGERQRMGQAGREAFWARFTFPQMLTNTLAVYDQVLGGPAFGQEGRW